MTAALDRFGLPRRLADGLWLRWATPADADELAEFNVRIHSDNAAEPETFIAYWTHALMDGNHPTTRADDFTVVVDPQQDGRIVSSLNLISQTWSYDGIPFGVGRPELVGTDPAYRRRGLVRQQMDAVHAKSDARGELVQGITGIPWYYRLFGYEMALNLGGGRELFWNRPGLQAAEEPAAYTLRRATPADRSQLVNLYAAHCRRSLISRVRDEAQWQYELTHRDPESPDARHFYLVKQATGDDGDGAAVAYVEFQQWRTAFVIRELGVIPGHSWRRVALFLVATMQARAAELNREREKPIDHVSFRLGESHPVYDALGRQLEQPRSPYAWYIRVPDLPAFLGHIRPVLERRLADSVVAGYTGTLRLNFYQQRLTLPFTRGVLGEIGTYEPDRLAEGDARFPGLTFLQLLFGYRDVNELDHAFADCLMQDEARVLLGVLFPKQPSDLVPLA